eukprot:TRINITY_DN48489_c0_g1_i1.p1 TRINITY_DN48489_c0_g1~~TRINITY_DN48489_c0_g1_i1.p1  ORF type:complete len:289 (+),score=54.42 TRINITY_DN48489_c0_g1_i1:147-1013(+)
MASSPGQRLGELQSCAGLGWVKFDPQLRQKQPPKPDDSMSASAITAALVQQPQLRCFGVRLSQGVAPAPDRAPRPASEQLGAASHGHSCGGGSGASGSDGSSSSGALPSQGFGEPFAQVADQTWAVVCAGQLSMIVPPSASSDAWEPCAVRCEGVSFRVERVPVDTTSASSRSHEAPIPRQKPAEQKEEASEETSAVEDYLQGALKGAKAVGSRAGSIVTFWGAERKPGAPAGPSAFAWEVAASSKRICIQAGKISRRSIEQVGRVVAFPFRLGTQNSGESKPGHGDA